jgi:tRNA G18 (ribose-2'-O)-methylase SpoU
MAGPAVIRIDQADDPAVAEFLSIRERDLTGRLNRFIAEGTVVLPMLAAAHRRGAGLRAEKLLILENRLAALQPLLGQFPSDVPVYCVTQSVMDQIAGFHLHRGVLALGIADRSETTLQLLQSLPAAALVLVCIGMSNHDNVGSIFRNAAAFGVDCVLLDETSCDPLYRKAIRVSVGSVLTVPFARQHTAQDLLDLLQQQNFTLIGLSPRGATDIADLQPAGRTAVIVGTEGEGLPQSILSSIATARIAQKPGLDSLNVATATGIALHQVARNLGRI